MALITFIIPVRHPANSKDWKGLARRLGQTTRSIAAQTDDDWRGIIVANEGAEIPPLPAKFDVEWVDFPPNPQHEIGGADIEKVYDAFRLDKGRRVLKGMLSARDSAFFMIVDDDDFVSANIAKYISKNSEANGWTIEEGYRWTEGGRLLLFEPNFANACGTSHVVRADLYRLPRSFEEASESYIKTMLGSHIRIGEILADQGTPLAKLPFPGAVYRVGHTGAHSKSKGLLESYVLSPRLLRHPRMLLSNLRRFRFLNHTIRREFSIENLI